MTAKATTWWPAVATGSVAAAASPCSTGPDTLVLPPEEPGRPEKEHDGHDHENHRVGGFRVEELGQPLHHAQREAGDDGAHDRPHAADDDDREDDDDEVGAHERVDLVDGRCQHSRDARQGDPEAV